MKAKVKVGFFNKVLNTWHEVGEVIDLTKKRFDEINKILPEYLEELSDDETEESPEETETTKKGK